MRAIVMHENWIEGQCYECLFKVICGDEDFIEEKFKELQIKTRKALRLHYETEEERNKAWF